jgi:hypothetical protein
MKNIKTFDDVPAEMHKEVAVKVIKHCLKQYYRMSNSMYPQSSVLRETDAMNTYPGDIFNIKLDIDKAVDTLSLRLKKIIIMHFIMDVPVGKVCSLLGYKFRVDLYRKLDEAFNVMYEELGPNWLRTNDANYDTNKPTHGF